MPLDVSDKQLLGLIELVRREPDAAGVFVDWLIELPRSWDEARKGFLPTTLADVILLYALPPSRDGKPATFAQQAEDNSLLPLLATWCERHGDNRADQVRHFTKLQKEHATADFCHKRHLLTYFDDMRVRFTTTCNDLFRDPGRPFQPCPEMWATLHCDEMVVNITERYSAEIRCLQSGLLEVTWWCKPSYLLPPKREHYPAPTLPGQLTTAELLEMRDRLDRHKRSGGG